MNKWLQHTSKLLQAPDLDRPQGGSGKASASESAEEQELVRRSQSGDLEAFDLLVTQHRGRVYGMVINMVKNEADAWDLSQEVFLKAWKALPRFEARSQFSTWLYRITHNTVYDWMRKKKVSFSGEFNDELLSQDTIAAGTVSKPQKHDRPDQALARSELRLKIQKAINSLSPEHCEVIQLREIQGLEYKEIADILECSTGTVMSRLFYARKKLQTLLEDEKPTRH